ncbi:MAG: YicC family protein [Proteobacteria bacterium]|nr:YicC family protein [Pseudomonadota bacterium]MDA0896894.1 YicC family protein [Pseudomonadota bacterium]MDA1244397.1 YicC family protein [Pseudomonadota bacterium]
MTAFTRQQIDKDYGSLAWEIRSVNHRYLEASVRVPESFRALENTVREALRKQLNRGKVECQLRFQTEAADGASVSKILVDTALVKQLLEAGDIIGSLASDVAPLSTAELLRWPGVIGTTEIDKKALEQDALALFSEALSDLIATREREGAELCEFILQRLDTIRAIVADVRLMMPDILAKQRQNLIAKIAEIEIEIDPARLEQEIALLAQKADIDEELDRLGAHVNEVERVLRSDDQMGRRLDFLMQELNREANTLSSKSIVVETTRSAVDLKVLIEQMREQIQNIE